MAPLRRRRVTALPSWAKLLPPRHDKVKSLSLEEEEAYLRTRCYHAMARKIDVAINEALDTSDIQETLALLHSQTSEQEPPAKKIRPDIARFTIDPPKYYDTSLLPVILLEGPFSTLDRSEWMHRLYWESKESVDTASVWLQPSLPVSWQEETTRQCLLQEPDEVFASRNQLATLSLTDILITWAKMTRAFKRIVIYLQVEDEFYDNKLQDFIQWLAERRAWHGLPFSLVLTGPHPGRCSITLRSMSHGPSGILLYKVILPTSKVVLDRFWENLYTDCIPLTKSTVEQLADSYSNEHCSTVRTALQLKLFLANFMKEKGSFLTFGFNVLPHEKTRMKWFLMHPNAEKYISYTCMKSQRLVDRNRNRNRTVEKLLSLSVSSELPNFLSQYHSATQAVLSQETKLQMLTHLKSRRLEAPSEDGEYIDLINQLIILVDHSTFSSDIYESVRSTMDEWDDHLKKHQFAQQVLRAQPRRDTVLAMVDTLISRDPLSSLWGILYKAIQERATISQSEWFEYYSARNASLSRQDAFSLFTCGANYLKLLGFIKEKRLPGKNETMYEKALLVWCSGD